MAAPDPTLLAELEVWHSRPMTPTRRVALGHLVLPCDPAPGLGGLLLGAVVAHHGREADDDEIPDLHRLVDQLSRGERIVQPRLRHRFQADRQGLARSTHRLVGLNEELTFDFANQGSPMQQVLGAIYAVERLEFAARFALTSVLHKALGWRGPIGPSLISHLAGSRAASLSALADPRAWALEMLGFPLGTAKPSKKQILGRFRDRLRDVHPDYGGDETVASGAIEEITEARRILLEDTK